MATQTKITQDLKIGSADKATIKDAVARLDTLSTLVSCANASTAAEAASVAAASAAAAAAAAVRKRESVCVRVYVAFSVHPFSLIKF